MPRCAHAYRRTPFIEMREREGEGCERKFVRGGGADCRGRSRRARHRPRETARATHITPRMNLKAGQMSASASESRYRELPGGRRCPPAAVSPAST